MTVKIDIVARIVGDFMSSVCILINQTDLYFSLSDSVNSQMGSLDENSPDTAFEHASVEVVGGIPGREHLFPLAVDDFLLGLVVGLENFFPAILLEEGLTCSNDLVEELLGLGASGH